MPIALGTCGVLFGARPKEGSRSHPTLIPQSSNPNPMDASSWRFLGPLRGMQDHWAIDVTAFSLQNSLLLLLFWLASRGSFGCGTGPLPDSSHQPTRGRPQDSRLRLQIYIRGGEGWSMSASMSASMKVHNPSPYPSLLALHTVLVAVGRTNTS